MCACVFSVCLKSCLSIFRNWKGGIEIRVYPAFIYFVMYKTVLGGLFLCVFPLDCALYKNTLPYKHLLASF